MVLILCRSHPLVYHSLQRSLIAYIAWSRSSSPQTGWQNTKETYSYIGVEDTHVAKHFLSGFHRHSIGNFLSWNARINTVNLVASVDRR